MFHFDIHDISLIARVAGECTVLKDFFADILRQCAPVCVLFLSPSLRASPCGFDFLEHGVFWVDAVLTRQLAFRRLAGYAKVWHSITYSLASGQSSRSNPNSRGHMRGIIL